METCLCICSSVQPHLSWQNHHLPSLAFCTQNQWTVESKLCTVNALHHKWAYTLIHVNTIIKILHSFQYHLSCSYQQWHVSIHEPSYWCLHEWCGLSRHLGWRHIDPKKTQGFLHYIHQYSTCVIQSLLRCIYMYNNTNTGYIFNNVLPSTHHCLYHLFPSGPHFIDKLKDVEVISLLQSLHHCIKSDESASATHTSTEKNYTWIRCI